MAATLTDEERKRASALTCEKCSGTLIESAEAMLALGICPKCLVGRIAKLGALAEAATRMAVAFRAGHKSAMLASLVDFANALTTLEMEQHNGRNAD